MIHLDYRDPRPIYLQIRLALRRQIFAGVLGEGDKLPSVRELATTLAINPNTIQRAYRELEAEDCICSIPGKGSFVCPPTLVNRAREQALLEQFDEITRELLLLGATSDALCRRIPTESKEQEALSP